MNPDHLLQSLPKIDIKRGSPLRRFLFEDDHDFRHAIINFLTSKATVHRFVSRGLAAVSVALFGLGLAVAAQVASRQPATNNTDRATVVNDEAASSNLDDSPELFPACYPPANTLSILGVMASAPEHNYAFGFLSEMTAERSSKNSSGSGQLVIAQNGSGSSGGSQSGIGGGGAGGAPSGGGTAPRVVEAAEQTVTTVPDAGSSVALLGFGLAVIGCGRFSYSNRGRKAR
jgi:hypothetical protein